MIVFLICLGAFALIVLLGGLYAYMQAFYAKAGKENIDTYFGENEEYQNAKQAISRLVSEMDECASEEIYIKAHDGVKLFALYYHIKDGAPVQIMMHGYKGNSKRDMCGGHKLARRLGHNILLIDQRGCGKSGGKTVTFGVKERLDALSWINYINQRFGKAPIFLVGVSMGGATALMATDLDLPDNVVGAIADCPFSSPKAIIKKVCADRGMPEAIYPFVTFGAYIYGHFSPNKEGAVKSVQNAKIPILILHGTNDGFVPHKMSEEIYNACTGKKYFHSFDGADHGMSFMSNPSKYENATIEFIDECLKSSK
ncbi:MAG: alpha/beta hydrolase [Clostridia bacterium]|nr:alpha/beta hydrolase [Clostridia bacterium]